MAIQTIDLATYKRERKICDKAEAYRRTLPVPYCVTKEQAAHKDYAACDNDMRGRVEQFELLHDTPERLVAYIGDREPNGMGLDRLSGRTFPLTVWTGDPIGYATLRETHRTQWGRMYRVYAWIRCRKDNTEREFTGVGQGVGMCVSLRETAESKRKRGAIPALPRVTHKDVEAACDRYNKALKLHYWRGKRPPSVGYLMWANIRGDGHSKRGLWSVTGEGGGVGSSDLRGRTMRETILRIDLAIKFDRLQSYQVITQAIHERGETQRAAMRELRRRGLWLSDEQKSQAGVA